jgi:hypothetical protein
MTSLLRVKLEDAGSIISRLVRGWRRWCLKGEALEYLEEVMVLDEKIIMSRESSELEEFCRMLP